MPPGVETAIITGIISIIGIAIGALLNAKGNRRVTEAESEASPYAALAERVVELERQDEIKGKKLGELNYAKDVMTRQIAGLEAELGRYITFYEDLHTNWDKHREAPKAPVID